MGDTRTTASADVLESLLRERWSCRAYRDEQVPQDTIERMLEIAQRSASWCNTQPWKLIVTRGEATDRFREALLAAADANPGAHDTDFPPPTGFTGVYRDRRRESGWQLYDAVGIAKGDREASAAQARENFRFFGAPHTAVLTTDAELGVYGAVDTGLYIGSLLLAAQALGLGAVPQAAIAFYAPAVREHFSIPDDRKILAGVSFGFADEDAAVNGYRTSRAPLSEVVEWAE